MKLFFALALSCAIFVSPAWPAQITITVDESSSNPAVPNNVSFNSGVLILCEAFDGNSTTCSGANVGDVISFSGGNIMQFFSDREPGEPAAGVDTGVPNPLPNFGVGQFFTLENGPEGNNGKLYNPAATDPGGSLVAGDTYRYVIVSDTPEPSSVVFAVAGLALVCMRRIQVHR